MARTLTILLRGGLLRAAVLVELVAPVLIAQGAPPASPSASRLSVERLTMGPAFTGPAPAAPQWAPSSASLAFLWNPPGQAGRTLWVVPRTGGAPRRLLPATSSASVSDFVWTPAGDAIAYVQQGNVALVSITTGTVTSLTTDGAGAEALTVAPNGQWISFLRDGDLWLLPTARGAATRVTQVSVPPIGAVALGTYFRRDAEIGSATWSGPSPTYAWAPDSRTIAVHAVDRRAVPAYGMPYYLGGTPQLNRVRRGAPGEVNEVRRVGLLDVATRQLQLLALPDSSTTRVVQLAWSATGTLLIDRESDDAIERTVYTVTPAPVTATANAAVTARGNASAAPIPRLVWRDRRESRVYTDIHSTWSADGRSILLTGDLDDRYRLYRITPGDTTPVPLTPATHDVEGDGQPRAATRSIDYVSNAPRPAERHVWRVNGAGGAPRQLTTRPGTHAPFTSPDGRTVALISSSDREPPELYLLDTAPGATEQRITTSTTAEFAQLTLVAPRYLAVPRGGDSVALAVRLLVPPGLDTTKRYPVLFGPVYSNTVRNRWGGMNGLLQQYLAVEEGYLVVQVDVRGSTGYGRAFREAFLMDWGGGDLDDLETVVRHLRTLPYVDAQRFGIWGSSYGGTLTVYSLLRKPGLFQAGVAAAAAVDPSQFGSDDVAITRRPQSHPDAFRRGALQYAGNLRDHLLLIHGMQDDVVPFASIVTLAEELMRQGKDFDFAFAPAATHGWTQRPYYARYLLTRLVEHFRRYLAQ